MTAARRGRTGRVVALLLVVAVSLGACGSTGPTGGEQTTETSTSKAKELLAMRPIAVDPVPALPATTTGADGHKTTVARLDRIVVLNGGVAEILWSLGLGGKVVGRDVSTTFPEAAAVPLVTKGHQVSVEGVLSLRPDVVLADARIGPKEAIDALRAAGVPVLALPEAASIDAIAPRIRAVAAGLGVVAPGEALVARTAEEIAAAKPASDGRAPQRVAFLYVRGGASVYLLGGRGSGADAMIQGAGAVDVGAVDGSKPFTPLTAEALVADSPDVLLVMKEGLESVGGIDGLVKLAGVAQTPAGQSKKVIAMDDGLLLGFGPRTPAALHQLADALQSLR